MRNSQRIDNLEQAQLRLGMPGNATVLAANAGVIGVLMSILVWISFYTAFSVPRDRGQPQAQGGVAAGTIPTHVRNTHRHTAWRNNGPDHPHARGEHDLSKRIEATQRGPSPRTWGTRIGLVVGQVADGRRALHRV